METGIYKVNPLRDVTGRYTGKSVNIGNLEVDSESVEYRTSEKYLTHMPEKIIYKDTTLTYGYDVNGNISEISKNGELQTRYKYDSIGRLIREDNKVLNTSTTYKYDNNGNIVERKRGVYTLENEIPEVTTDTYIYFPNGRLQSYNGASMSYERTYNPTIYLGKTMSWTRGRKLSLYNGTSFEYDGMGRRIKKNDIEYSYDCNGRLIKQSDGLEYYYDTTGLLGFSYNDRNYVYRKDIQGNIIGILDNIGRVVVEYKYDAWGRHTVSGSNVALGNKNPFRYRGYYYDTETELYYLQSRYYDPKLCRFINMDSLEYAEPERINGLNLFAYCGNNPVMFVDPSGQSLLLILGIAALLFTPVGGVIMQTTVSIVSYTGMAIASLFDEQIREDMNAIGWNPFNSSEQAVLDSSKVSFYKGVPVYRINGNRSGSFYAMFLTYESNKRENPKDIVRHEWGHNIQAMIMGPGNYGLTVGIMSPLNLRASKWGNYYNSPWETTADMLGGVQERKHKSSEKLRAIGYTVVGTLCFPLAYLFLI